MQRKIILALLCLIMTTSSHAQTTVPEFKNKVMVLTKNNSLDALDPTNLSIISGGGFSKEYLGLAVAGANSSVVYDTKAGSSFIVKIDPGIDPESVITLYKFIITKKKREIHISSNTIFKGGKYDDQQIIKLNFKKVQDGIYSFTANLEPGEYFCTARDPNMEKSIPVSNGFAFSVVQ